MLTSFSTVYVNRGPPTGARSVGFPLLKKSARQKYCLDSRTLYSIKGLAHNLFHKMCEETGLRRDATIPQRPRGRNSGPSRRVHCVQVSIAQKLSFGKNFERNQRVSGRTMRLLTSFSTVCVKNPAGAYPCNVDNCLPKKRAHQLLFQESKA